MSLKITILYDNTSCKRELRKDWGFSCLIELESGKRILFDTGGSGSILLSNMKALKLEPKSIDSVFISHNHFDHIGGLSWILHENPEVEVYVPSSVRGVKRAKRILSIGEKPVEIQKNVFSTGELDNIEQSMLIKTEKGLVIIAGCSHPGVKQILNVSKQFGKPYALIGGLHGFSDFDLLSDIPLICPTHCTVHIKTIKKNFPRQYLEGGAGREIMIVE